MNSPSYAIQTNHLQKIFGEKVAVQDLSLDVVRGEVFGFLGPNGAGKTTSVKMLLSLVRPTSGDGFLLGEPLGRPETRRKIGFLPEHFRFHDWLNADEFLTLHADLYHMPRERSQTTINELLDLVGLAPHRTKKLREFSKGMLQRIGLAQAMLNNPELIILDEPTSGLDPVGRRLVRDIIRNLKEQGKTVFLNSHLLSEVEITCDRVAFIKHGVVIRTSHLKDLVEGELTVTIRGRNISPEAVNGLSRWSSNVRCDDEVITLTVMGESDLPEINRYLVNQRVDVYALQPQRVSLEDLFIEIVGVDGGL
ncbi:MAG: ABC transporter ATP-binding protein [Chloroflexi bacterium]|nr:MAG: ABC transporter ATP-binding protein [Chloroflexota bacterium]